MALPKLASTGASSIDNRVSNLGSKIGGAINPGKIISKGFEAVKSQIVSEIPELGSLSASVGSLITDIKNDLKNTMNNISADSNKEETNDNIKQIKDDTTVQSSMLDNLISHISNVDTNLGGSPPFLMTIDDSLNDIETELETLNDITKNAWNVNQDQLDITRQILKHDREMDKKSRFSQQKENSKTVRNMPKVERLKDKKKNKGLLDFLGGAFLGRLIFGFGAILSPVLGLIAEVATFLKLTKLGNSIKGLSGKAKVAGKTSSKFAQAAGGTAKGAGVLGKAGGLLKGVGKTLGPIGLAITLVESVFGAVKRGLVAYLSGASAGKVLEEVIRGAIFTPLQSFLDIGTLLTGKEMINLEESFNYMISQPKEFFLDALSGFANISNKFTEWAGSGLRNAAIKSSKFVAEKFMNIVDPIVGFLDDLKSRFVTNVQMMKAILLNGFKDLINNLIEKAPFSDKIRNSLSPDTQKFLANREPMPQVGELSPKSKSAGTAANMIAGQQGISEFEMESLMSGRYGSQGSIVNAPSSTNIQNNNMFSGNIHTRNPDSPLFLGNKVMP